MSLESAIVAQAAATASLVSAIGNRFYNALAPQNATRPYVVFDMVGGEGRTRAMGDAVNMVRQRIQMTVVANSATTEIAAHDGLLAAFDWKAVTIGGTEIVHSHADGGRQSLSGEQQLPDTRVSTQDFFVFYRE
jgi:hypothetical protein